MDIQNIFIVGSKGCGNYGGYETFLDKLTEHHQDNIKIQYYIAWKGREQKEFLYHNAHCFQIKVPDIGSIQAIYYDIAALRYCLKHIKKYHVEHPIIYILACRIGPFARYFQKVIHKLGGQVYLNPDGHEWLRAKWNLLIRKYWKFSEKMMVRYSDLLICDSKNIEKYIQSTYRCYHPQTIHIAYGMDLIESPLNDDSPVLIDWYRKNRLKKKGYYLVVGRFVPENSFSIIIPAFMRSHTKRDLVIITTTNDRFQKELEKDFHYKVDPRIKFVGTVYDQGLLKKIRENAYAYLHGHTVGGTNPSLIEALGSTDLNLLVDVCFNREVGEDNALYWKMDISDLAEMIDRADIMRPEEIRKLGKKAKKRVSEEYTWEKITQQYEELFLSSYSLER